MKLLVKNNDFVENLFFETNSKKLYCKSKFNIIINKNDKYFVYNTLSKALAELSNEEHNILFENTIVSELTIPMIKAGFLVPNDCNEIIRLKEFLSVNKMFVNNKGFSTYTILPTLDCNARCYYCFEKKCQKVKMTDEIIEKICYLILQNYNKNKRKVLLDWYGGEPLYNSEVIDKITQFLQNNNVEYSSKMISNGYLFNEEMIKKASALWQLKNVQITLDGTKDIYNRVKNYIDACDSPFDRVLDNIDNLLKSNISVKVRLNLSKTNFYDLQKLIEILHQKFSIYSKFTVYVHALFELEEDTKNEFVWKMMDELEDKLENFKMLKFKKLRSNFSPFVCTAQNPQTVIILPDGSLCKCKASFEDSTFGNLNSEVIDKEILNSWYEETIRGENCLDCSLLPNCISLKKCNKSQIYCTKFEQNNIMKKYIKMIKNIIDS